MSLLSPRLPSSGAGISNFLQMQYSVVAVSDVARNAAQAATADLIRGQPINQAAFSINQTNTYLLQTMRTKRKRNRIRQTHTHSQREREREREKEKC